MNELKDILARLTTECEIEIEYIKSTYKHRKEKHIIDYIIHNVKKGDTFGDLEFIKCLGANIIFWNKTFGKEVILSPLDFLKRSGMGDN